MMLADMGAEVIRVDRAANVGRGGGRGDLLARGRKSIAIDLKNPQGIETILRLIDDADVLIEGFRPGVMERLGIGPQPCLERNPGLVYGRMTGWGQTGPMSLAAGHDINYISLTGALHAIGEAGGKPVPPLNLIGDFGGGGMLLAFGVLAALYERSGSGKGQVVDAAMTDGSALLMNAVFGMMNSGQWKERGTNMLDTGTHFYNTYETSDGKFISVGSIEPQFYEILLEKSGLGKDVEIPAQHSRDDWPKLKEQMAAIFITKTRDEWDEIMLGTDICYAPILSFAEAQKHQHNVERETFVEVEGVPQAAPAPRFDRTEPEVPAPASRPGEQTDEVLLAAGFEEKEVESLRAAGAVA
jgi:alpha-methylacyl-CoA racemase|tara:strand:- start:29 stop:1096 length:1068 start_codon:yes stop_codon:yes gene_type:complete